MAIATSHRFTDGDLPVEAGRYRLPPPPPDPACGAAGCSSPADCWA